MDKRWKVIKSRIPSAYPGDVLKQVFGVLSDRGLFINEATGNVFRASYTTDPYLYERYEEFGTGEPIDLLLEEYAEKRLEVIPL